MCRLILLALFVSPAFSQFSQTFQRACDLRNCQCGQENKPYCGTNEITYQNICHLECAQRQCGQNIRVKFEGVCAQKYVHDDGSRRSQSAESRNNFVVIRPPVYRPESPRLPATIPTRGYPQYGTTRQPSYPIPTKYVEYGTSSQRPTATYNQYEVTKRPPNYFEYDTTRKSTNSFEYVTSKRPTTNYFEYSRRPTTNYFEYNTTPRPYDGGNNILGNVYGSNNQGNDQKITNPNQVGKQYGDFYDYK